MSTIRYIHNISGTEKTYRGVPIADQAFYQIQSANLSWYQTSDVILADLAAGDLRMSNDGVTDYSTNPSENITFLLGADTTALVENFPFAAKQLANGKKIYKRVHGQSAAVSTSASTHKFTVPYADCKITGVEIIGGEIGDQVDFHILDTATGTVSTIPNYPLNQFGFGVYIAPQYHEEASNYDADLFLGLQIQVTYTSVSTKTVYFNYVLHEVKD